MRPERLDTAHVFERIFAIYRLQAGVLLPAAVILYVIPALLYLAGGFSVRALALAASIVAAVGYQGMVVQAVRDIQDGVRDLSLGGLFRSVSAVFAPLLWTAILVGIGLFLGFVAFIIPFFVLLTWWAVAAPVVVCEVRTAPQALGRSRELVRGHGWQVFGVIVVALLLVLIADLTLGGLANAISGSDIAVAIANLIAGTLTAPVFALASAVLYMELLLLKGESLPPADMGSFTDRS
ncbi:MAG TPA: hypothetical protein VH300_06105 [Thermoleophilaceae bacterium]|nr:hypothetical protein [Thermoleophilaceae bacterium]